MQSFNYGQVDKGYEKKNKKRIAIIGVSSLILVAMVVAVAVGVDRNIESSKDDEKKTNIQSSMKAIKAICQPTDYQQVCVDSLSSTAGNTSDPKLLVKAAFKVAMKQIEQALSHSQLLHEVEQDPRAKLALDSCKELMHYAIDDLKNSFAKVGEFDFSKIDEILDDIKVWLSATITYQETCMDGFKNTTSRAGESMKKALKTAGQLTSNGLAIITEVSSMLSSLQIPGINRRLLSEESKLPALTSDGIPAWVSVGKRKLLATAPSKLKPDIVVAKDGSGKFKTINAALESLPKVINRTFVIYIKEGVYEEQVQINRTLANLVMIGDGPTKTKVTGNKNFIDGTPTFKSATFAVIGDGFIARDMGFENSAGAEKHQAVALRVQSDMSIFYNCQMDGYQDTLYAHSKRQFYRECTISGTIDFIFGDAASIFQKCNIVIRKPLDNQQNIITAQGRKNRREPTGIVLQDCTITADPLYYPFRNTLKSYLGRPWKEYSRTIIMQTEIPEFIQPEGWLPWMGDFALNTCFYAEIKNKGPGASLSSRVKWKGVKTVPFEHAQQYSVARFIQGDRWIRASGVPYNSGLSPM